jgi:hypothetical protein
MIITAKFGPLSDDVRAAIKAITKPEQLKAMFERALQCRSLDELLSSR